MSLDELDPSLTPPKRLAAMGILAVAKKVEFAYLRDQLQLSDSDLSKQLKVLADVGYVTSNRTGKGKTRRSWFSATTAGRKALQDHADALQRLVNPATRPGPKAPAQAGRT